MNLPTRKTALRTSALPIPFRVWQRRVAPLIGGWLAGAMSYQAMFILSAIIGAVSWVLLRFAVREPRKMKSSTNTFLS